MSRSMVAAIVLAACASGTTDPESRPPRTAEPSAPTTDASTAAATPAVVDAGATPDGAVALADAGEPAPPVAVGPSTSIGSPNEGRLEGGVPLPARGEGFMLNERRINVDSFYGTTEMIGAIQRAAAVVAREAPGSTLVVNDIGFREGGDIPHHGSHRSGRDADILFYLTSPQGEPVASRGVVIEPDGTGDDFKDLADGSDDEHVKLDVRRTWRFVRALVEDPEALVQRIFVAEHVRTMLLAEGARVRAPRLALERAGDAMCQPTPPHDDHIHLRLFCTAEDMRAGCLDGYPMYPWRRRELAAAGIEEPMMAARRREPRDRPPRSAEPQPVLHRKVRALLERRRAWSGAVHPGRAWCN